MLQQARTRSTRGRLNTALQQTHKQPASSGAAAQKYCRRTLATQQATNSNAHAPCACGPVLLTRPASRRLMCAQHRSLRPSTAVTSYTRRRGARCMTAAAQRAPPAATLTGTAPPSLLAAAPPALPLPSAAPKALNWSTDQVHDSPPHRTRHTTHARSSSSGCCKATLNAAQPPPLSSSCHQHMLPLCSQPPVPAPAGLGAGRCLGAWPRSMHCHRHKLVITAPAVAAAVAGAGNRAVRPAARRRCGCCCAALRLVQHLAVDSSRQEQQHSSTSAIGR